MLHHKVAVEQNRFDFGERGVMAIQVRPAPLHHADFGIDEIGNHAAQKIRRGQKICVEDGHEFAGRGLQTLGERAGLVSGAVSAMQIVNRQAQRLIALHARARHLPRFVGGIVEHLNVQQLARIIEARHCIHQALDHVALVVDGKLYGNLGPLGDRGRRAGNVLGDS